MLLDQSRSNYSVVASQKTTPRWFYEKEQTVLWTGKQVHSRGWVSSQRAMSLNKGSDLSLFGEIMHKHQRELCHWMYTWGHICTCVVRKHACSYTACSKMVEKLHLLGGDFSIIRAYYESSSWRGYYGVLQAASVSPRWFELG